MNLLRRVRLWLYFGRHGYSAEAHGMSAWEFVTRATGGLSMTRQLCNLEAGTEFRIEHHGRMTTGRLLYRNQCRAYVEIDGTPTTRRFTTKRATEEKTVEFTTPGTERVSWPLELEVEIEGESMSSPFFTQPRPDRNQVLIPMGTHHVCACTSSYVCDVARCQVPFGDPCPSCGGSVHSQHQANENRIWNDIPVATDQGSLF